MTKALKNIQISNYDDLPFAVGEGRIRKLMRKTGIFCETVKKFRPHGKDKVYENGENILERKFNKDEINKVWATDITYIWIPNYGFGYLAAILDLA